MTKRIKIDELAEFDAAPYLDSEEAVAAYLTDIWKQMTQVFWLLLLVILPALVA